MRKLACLLLALAMIFALATTAFAAREYPVHSITITNNKEGETYDLYWMFDLIVDGEENPEIFTYFVNEEWIPFFTGDGEGSQYVTIKTVSYVDENGQTQYIYYVTDIPEENAAELAKAALKWAEGKELAYVSKVSQAKDYLTFEDLPNGYWLIGSSLGAVGMAETVPDKADVIINEKNPEPTIDKQVVEAAESEGQQDKYVTVNDAQIGQEVVFKSTVTIPAGARNLVLHDKMTEGFTFHAGSIIIAGLTKDVDYTVNAAPEDGHTFDITFSQDWLDELEAETVCTIEYTALLNSQATKMVSQQGGLLPQTNTTYLTYGNASYSQEKKTETYTCEFLVYKYDGTKYDADDPNMEPLAGAEFSLMLGDQVVGLVQEAEGSSIYHVAMGTEGETVVDTFTTVADSPILIKGVDSKAYTLVEIEAPEGYNRLSRVITVNVSEDGPITVKVENMTGTELPGTGGIGTTVFYVLGGILVLAAVVLLVTKKRMSAAK